MKMHAKVYSKPPSGTSQYTAPHATAFTCTETTTTAILSPLDATRNSLNGNGTRIAPRGIRNCARNNGRAVSPILSLLPFLVRVSPLNPVSSLFLAFSPYLVAVCPDPFLKTRRISLGFFASYEKWSRIALTGLRY